MKRDLKYFLLVAVLVGVVFKDASALVCREGACDTVRCGPVFGAKDCKDGQEYVPKGGFCGCCDTCVNILGEGDGCAVTQIRGVPPTAKCADGLVCKSSGDNELTCRTVE